MAWHRPPGMGAMHAFGMAPGFQPGMPPVMLSSGMPRVGLPPPVGASSKIGAGTSTDPMLPPKDTSDPVTLYVSKIPDDVENERIKSALGRCGSLTQWNRVIGGNMKHKPCGFATFGNPASAARALKFLHGADFGSGCLSVKVDAFGSRKIEAVQPPSDAAGIAIETQCGEAIETIVRLQRDAFTAKQEKKASQMTDKFMETMGLATADPSPAPSGENTLLAPPTLNVMPPPPDPAPGPAEPNVSSTSAEDPAAKVERQERRRRDRMDADFRSALRKLHTVEHNRELDKKYQAEAKIRNCKLDDEESEKQRLFEQNYDDSSLEAGDARHYNRTAISKLRRSREAEGCGWEAKDRQREYEEKGEIEPTQFHAPESKARVVSIAFNNKSNSVGTHTVADSSEVKANSGVLQSGSAPSAHSEASKKALAIFNDDDDDADREFQAKRRKLIKVQYTDEQMRVVGIDPEEERKKRSREIINSIPTKREELFAYPVHWASIDEGLISGRLQPWIDRKITEFIGVSEPTLVEFICSKVAAQLKPEAIVDELNAVLDDEAEIFVVKMWRVIVYETEYKKAGLAPLS